FLDSCLRQTLAFSESLVLSRLRNAEPTTRIEMSPEPTRIDPQHPREGASQQQPVLGGDHGPAARCLEHVRHLSVDIGPRGSTTTAEAAAAAYAWGVLDRLELSPRMQRFSSGTSQWRPYAVAVTLALLAIAVYPLAGRVTAVLAALVAAVTLVSAYLELNFSPNPIRWLLPKGSSHNVWAVLPPTGTARRRLVIVGHLDTHRTPFIFRTPLHLKAFQVLVTAGFASMAALVLLYLAGAIVQSDIIYLISLGPAAVLLIDVIMTIQPDMTPYTPGANDNASGAAVVLTLAERLKHEPLANTEVWLVNSGCEEVGCYGAAAFLREHREELKDAYFVALDSLAGPDSGPCYITREGMTRHYRSDPHLIALADQIAADRPELGAYSKVMALGFTEGAIGIKNGLPTLTFVNLRPDGVLPYWHRPDDVFENIDPDVLARTQAFLWELIQRIDREQ
ncbi:MAG: M28 family metallopeptidase, partial [Dehalococcoidia bacterium]